MYNNIKPTSLNIPQTTPEVKKEQIKYSELARITYITGDELFVLAYQGKSYAVTVDEVLTRINRISLGLDKVDNTSDLDKPISLDVQDALEAKANKDELAPFIARTEVTEGLALKAERVHTHALADIPGLVEILDTKVGIVHQHTVEDVSGLLNILANKANVTHSHSINEVDGLANSLDAKAARNHLHDITDISGLSEILNNIPSDSNISIRVEEILLGKGYITDTEVNNLLDTKANSEHSHQMFQVAGLLEEFLKHVSREEFELALTNKANNMHEHSVSNIIGLNERFDNLVERTELTSGLNTKAGLIHTHEMSSITGLEAVLETLVTINALNQAIATKANVTHTHFMTDITGLSDEFNRYVTKADNSTDLNSKANLEHSHALEDVLGLEARFLLLDNIYENKDSLDNKLTLKANINHTHEIQDVNGLRGELDSLASIDDITDAVADKANTVHQHSTDDINGLVALIDSRAVSSGVTEEELATALEGVVRESDVVPIVTSTVDSSIQNKDLIARYEVNSMLNEKADNLHRHSISDIDSLDIELSLLATTNYVDAENSTKVSIGLLEW